MAVYHGMIFKKEYIIMKKTGAASRRSGLCLSVRKHRIHLLNALVFHGLRGMQIPFARDIHCAVAQPPLNLLDVHACFAQLCRVGMAQAVKVKFLVAQLMLDHPGAVRHCALLYVGSVQSCVDHMHGLPTLFCVQKPGVVNVHLLVCLSEPEAGRDVLRLFTLDTDLSLKHRQNPLSASDALNNTGRQIFDDIAETVDHFFKCWKDFVSEASFADFFPYLLNGIHFWSIWWNER